MGNSKILSNNSKTFLSNSDSQDHRMISSYSIDKKAKITLLGERGVGKSSIIFQYGLEFSRFIFNKTLNIDGEEIELQILNTSGQERYINAAKGFYRNIMGALIVFDLTNKESFNNINAWLDIIKKNAPEETIKILVGNKSDLKTNRIVTKEEIIKLSNDTKIEYFETSAKDNTGINEAFLYLGTLIKREKLDKKILDFLI